MEYIALTIAFIALFVTLGSRSSQRLPGVIQLPPAKTAEDTLGEIKAKEELEKNYEFVEPDYAGTFLGKKVNFKDVDEKMLSDVRFVRSSGEWVKKSARKTSRRTPQ